MITSTEWRFTALQFVVLWESLRRDRLPFPLTWRAEVATADDLARERAAAVTEIDDRLAQALRLLSDPVVRVHTCGFVDGELGGGLHAAIAASLAVVARQNAGHIDVELMPSSDVASRITLPPLGPGKERGGTVTTSASVMTNSGDDRRRLTQLLNRRRSGGGEVLVGTSTLPDCSVDVIAGGFTWIDVVDDGRYLLSGTDPATVTPATSGEVTALIARELVGRF